MMQTMRLIAHVAAATALLLAAGCSTKTDSAKPDEATTVQPGGAMSAAPATSTPPTPSRIVDFGEKGVEVQTAADAAKLKGTSEEFQEFIADLATHLERPAGGEDCFVGVTVAAYDPAGFARGGVNDCGGYVALWGRKDGRWKELIGTQDAWTCADLKKFGLPPGLVTTCIGPVKGEMKEVPYTGQ
jgi:hypothetical protein